VPQEARYGREWLSVEGSTLMAEEKSGEGILYRQETRPGEPGRDSPSGRPERFPQRGRKREEGIRGAGCPETPPYPDWTHLV